jgi:pimeloyl-[acyl-carrier protein] synthase
MLNTITPDLFINNPYSIFNSARENSPVLFGNFLNSTGWLITGYKEVEFALKDPRFIKEGRKLFPPESLATFSDKVMPAIELTRNMMLFRDAPDHTRLRNLVNKAFTPKMVERMRPAIEDIASYLLENRHGYLQHELVRDFSYLLPVFVITDLLGVPKEDRELFRKWSDAFIKFIDFNTTMDDLEAVSDDLGEASHYFRELISKRRVAPQEDLISGLIQAEANGDNLNESEMIATCLLLLVAGHETTVNLITNAYYLLLTHPEQLKLVQEDRSLIPSVIEETLRYEPPVLMTSRWIAEDMEVAGQQLKKGQIAFISLAGANRDPLFNENPDTFDIQRKSFKHLSFASGPHFCLGAPLARLEGIIALEKLLDFFTNPRLLETPKWRKNIAFRGFEALHFEAETR